MPIKIDGKVYSSFKEAVKHIMKLKGWGEERASAYVATVERKQRTGRKPAVKKMGRKKHGGRG